MFNLFVLHQVEHKGWFHPNVLNQTWSTDKLNMQGDSIQRFWTRHEVLTNWTFRKIQYGIFLYVQFVSTSCLVQTFVLHHPVCSTCQYLMSGTKLLDGITLYVQLVCSSCLIQNIKLNIQGISIQVEHTGWFHPSFEPDMKYWQVEHTRDVQNRRTCRT
jgi:hypothetical protein